MFGEQSSRSSIAKNSLNLIIRVYDFNQSIRINYIKYHWKKLIASINTLFYKSILH